MANKLIPILFIICLIPAKKSSAFPNRDSSAIYFTKEQFEKNLQQLKSTNRIKEKAGIMWSDFDYEASGIMKIKINKNDMKEFNPGDIYGFILNGIKFMYIESEKKYLAVMNDHLPVIFFVKKSGHFGCKFLYMNSLLLSNDSLKRVKEFNKKNIAIDFNKDQSVQNQMLDVLGEIKTYEDYLSRKNFFKCQKAIEKHFNAQQEYNN